MFDVITWPIARAYARLYGVVKDRTGRNLRGLGRMLRMVRRDHTFPFNGLTYHFDHAIAGSYDRMVAGDFNEPQTRRFLDAVLRDLDGPFTFIDVGANVGEFLITSAAHPKVARAIGFEPHPRCAEVCRQTARMNNLHNVTLHQDLVGDGAAYRFRTEAGNPNASGIGSTGEMVETVKLDDMLSGVNGAVILLIDVEGAEPIVMRGARSLIERARPLIIFEYNYVSRAVYQLDDVRKILGSTYHIYRMRDDGRLDDDVEDSWNCVAVPAGTAFESVCRKLHTDRRD